MRAVFLSLIAAMLLCLGGDFGFSDGKLKNDGMSGDALEGIYSIVIADESDTYTGAALIRQYDECFFLQSTLITGEGKGAMFATGVGLRTKGDENGDNLSVSWKYGDKSHGVCVYKIIGNKCEVKRLEGVNASIPTTGKAGRETLTRLSDLPKCKEQAASFTSVTAQPEKEEKSQADKPLETRVRVQLEDGSSIRCNLVGEIISLRTHYGTLKIPVSEIRKVRFGIHRTTQEDNALTTALRGLGSDVYTLREKSSRELLELGRLAVPELRKATSKGNPESMKRAQGLLEKLAEVDSRECHEEDLIETTRFTVNGTITDESLTFRSTAFTEFSARIGRIESLYVLTPVNASFKLEAEHVMNESDKWVPTKLMLIEGERVKIVAAGAIDISPPNPGTYIVTPDGGAVAGHRGQPAGLLLCKIGNGNVVRVGSKATFTPDATGELYFQIVASTWAAIPSGSYSVSVKEHK